MTVRVGLVRHFPVNEPLPSGWRTGDELDAWRERYDQATIQTGPFDLGGIPWQVCLSSDLPRAMSTAQHLFDGPIEVTPWLREAEFSFRHVSRYRLPVWVWHFGLRAMWATRHRSQRTFQDDFLRRVALASERLLSSECDTLVVSHAGMMHYLSAVLRRRGMMGPKIRLARHAVVYVYTRSDRDK